jgi:DNA-binding NarL/FixJ family response regulator
MMIRARVLIADDHTLIAELCKRLLEVDFDVVGVVTDGRALVHAAAEFRPDVIMVDVTMPVLNGLDAGRQVKEFRPPSSWSTSP